MRDICEQLNLLCSNDNVVRLPLLIKGKIVPPPEVSKTEITAAFEGKDAEATYAKVGGAQVLREPIIDRNTMKYTGEYQYQVLAEIDPLQLIERDIDKLARELYALPFVDVLDYLRRLVDAMRIEQNFMDEVRELTRATAQHPDLFHDMAFGAFSQVLSPNVAKPSVDAELALGDIPGSEFLDGWVDLPHTPWPGISMLIAQGLFNGELPNGVGLNKPAVRAMPTRQLHITAGNAPAVPVISLLRAIATKSAAVIKSPFGAVIPGALAGLAAVKAAPDHPITKNLSLVYWPGGERAIEDVLFLPTAFDRIIVWGSPDAVTSVQARAKLTRTVCFNPRYGLSMIGKEAFNGNLREVAIKASIDSLIWNQKACTAAFVQYVEGSEEQAEAYARELKDVLAKWDEGVPNFVPPRTAGKLRRMKRGKYMNASWHVNTKGGNFSSGVVATSGQFDMLDHPMCRSVIVRRVDDLKESLAYLHHGVAAVGVYPESRRLEMRDSILARGVTYAIPLGQVERTYGGMPHDGMLVLNDLVEWKSA